VQAETQARFSLAATPRGAAQGRRTCRSRERSRESVGTDSRVLRRDGAVDTPAEPSGAKLFSRGESGSARLVKHAKARANAVRVARDFLKVAPSDVAEIRISSALPRCLEFIASSRADKKIRRDVSPAIATRAWRRGARRRLYTKLRGVTVIFFPL
jgi:hypothetical protein